MTDPTSGPLQTAAVEEIVATRRSALAALGPGARLVDLTRTLGPDTVMWPGSSPPVAVDVETLDADGSHGRLVTLHEHSGTHLDAPAHFVPGGDTTATLSLERLVVAVRMLDISAEARIDPNAIATPETIEAHERAHGPISRGSAVVLHTGWGGYRDRDPATADDLAFPGFGVPAAQLLVRRGVVGLGVDTLGIDPGDAVDFPVHRDVSHPAGLWHLEGLTNLRELPPAGAVLVVGVPRLVGGTGFPARVFAFVPDRSR